MRKRLSLYILWIFTVVRITWIKIIALIISLILSTYLFVSPHTYVITKLDTVKRVQPISVKDAFLHYMQDPEGVYGIEGFFLALPFLNVFYLVVLIIQSNSEKKWIRLFYIVQGIMLSYFAWHVTQFKVAWIVLPALPSDEFYTIINFRLMLIQLVGIGISIWSVVKGALPRLSFEVE